MHTSAPPIDLMPMAVDALAWKQECERRALESRAEELREISHLLQSAPVRITGITLLSNPRSRNYGSTGWLSDDVLVVAESVQGIEPAAEAALANVGLRLYGRRDDDPSSLFEHTQARWMLSVAWKPISAAVSLEAA